MEKEYFEFMGELLKRFADCYKKYRNNDCSILIEHHPGKDYWTIDTCFRSGNSKFEDCVVFYLTDDFNASEILTDFDAIIRKADLLLK